ncbi:fibronectin type III domain-containing protein [Jonesiaceae bacterium BS-20]|uniref:Fibronectin type III domain-containing protein n=1 Tax=Jonesiaceae bacterium BS-20 TaxID=3120821 RepID=A0AAU7DU58_9MICO
MLATLAVINPGIKVSEVDLNDGAVWITNTAELKLGRFNTQVKELNGAVFSPDPLFDVLQHHQDVLLVQPARLAKVDPANMELAMDIAIPAESTVNLGNSTVTVTTQNGDLYVQDVAALSAITEEDEPTLTLGPGGVGAVSTQGIVYGLEPATATIHGLAGYVDGTAVGSRKITLPQATDLTGAQLTLVGETPVVLAGSSLYTEKTVVDLSPYGTDPVAQHPGENRSQVLVATSTHLLDIDLTKGTVTVLSQDVAGPPTQPVWLNNCAHGAWASPENNYVRACGADVEELTLDQVSASASLKFRINRNQLVLNDVLQGRVWLQDEIPQSELPNWSEIIAPKDPESADNETEENESQTADLNQCEETDTPPDARDDAFGVRAGHTSILPVLNNDVVGQCGIIAISEISELDSDFGVAEVIAGGRALQVQVHPDANGTAKLTYAISDGRGTNPPSAATMTLTVHGDRTNVDPEQNQTLRGEVEVGGSLSMNALAAFWDPDGDFLVLQNAVLTEGPGAVQFRQDGMVTFVADPAAFGTSVITLTVSDGRGGVATGTMEMTTRSVGTLTPIIDPIHEVGFVTQPVEVDVLSAVQSRSKEPARLAAVEPVAGTTAVPNFDAGTFTFTAPSIGTYYLRFTVVAGPHTVTGLARIDIRDFSDQDQKPIAVADLALLPAGGEVTVAPLDNDFDPRGGVLVLTGVQTAPESALTVGVIENRLVKISSRIGLTEPEEVSYEVDNGVGVTRGTILVQPVPPSAQQHAPVVTPIKVTVRTSGVVTIPVLDFVSDPDGDPVRVLQDLPQPLESGEGLLFVSGDTLRYQAPGKARTTNTIFNVMDSAGNISTGELTVVVHESTPESKSPPTPLDLTARTYSGKPTLIQIPLTGIDSDGDGVVLLGLGDQVPTLGHISAIGADWLEYTADMNTRGTDTFTYAVEDWTGQRAVGTIRVGIVADPAVPLPIVASDDEVTVTPGTTVEVRVLRNDVDPSGQELTLEPLGVIPGVSARVDGRRIVVEVPDSATGTIAIPYAVRNALGNTGAAVLRVHVNPEAELAAPIARDIVVAPLEVLDKDIAEIDVLEVAENPSGALSDLEVSVPTSHSAVATVTPDGKVTILLGPNAQTIPYRLTNVSTGDRTVYSYAFITVPAKGDFPPVLRPKTPELRVASGTELTIPLAAYVQVGTGKQAHIRDPESVRSNQSDGTSLLTTSDTLRFVSKPGYAGKASITFEVWDYAVPTEGERSTVLTLPISVFAEDKLPPVFQATTVMVPQGSSPVTVDLLQLTSFPDGTTDPQVTYRSTGVSKPGVRVDIEGSQLQISADETVARGTQGQVQLTIGYGLSGQSSAVLNFAVVASNLPKPAVNNHTVNANAGEPKTIDVLAGANDPFGQGLRVSAVSVLTQGTAAVAQITGNQVLVTPGPDFAGTVELAAVVTDALNDPNRSVESRIQVHVRKVAEPPRTPTVTDTSSRTVKLSWDAPNANGAPIIDYLVTQSPGGTTTMCASTSCAITGLTNGTEYTFTVQARNEVGLSEHSKSSVPVTPNALPAAPAAPSIVDGDRELNLSWTAPENEGSAITSYTVEISPAIAGRNRFEATTTALNIKGATNGTGYTAKVRANNAAKRQADDGWSPASLVAIPAGRPGAPAITAMRDGDGRIRVTWTSDADTNGAPLTGYIVTFRGEGGVVKEIDASTHQWVFTQAINGLDYEVEVQSQNRVGKSRASNKVRVSTHKAPDAPTGGTATNVPGRSFAERGAVRLEWQAPASTGGVGVTIKRYEIEGLSIVAGNNTSFVVTGLTPGQSSQSYRVRAVSSRDEVSNWITIAGTQISTRAQAPTISASGGWETYNFTVNPGQDGGATAALTYRLNGSGPWQPLPANGLIQGSYTDFANGATTANVQVEVRATNEHGDAVSQASTEVKKKLPPLAPQSLSGTQIGRLWEVELNWLVSQARGTPVTGYEYCIDQCTGQGQWKSTNGLANSFIITNGLTGLTTVNIKLRATSERGNSPEATVQVTLTPPEPDPEPEPEPETQTD